MRCVEWVVAFGVITMLSVGALCAATETGHDAPTAAISSVPLPAPSEDEDLTPDDFASSGLLESSLEAELGSGLGGSLGAALERSLAASLKAQLGGGLEADIETGEFASAMASMPSAAGVSAAALTTPFPSTPMTGGSQADQVLLFGGYDLWRNGQSATAGLHWAANGLDQDGFVVRLVLSDGVERYRSGRRTFITDISRGSLLAGWRLKAGEFELKLFAGPDFEDHNLTPDDVRSMWRGPHLGIRVAAEAWAQPTPELMLAASFYATTIADGYGFRAATGWRLLDGCWVGPELSGSRDQFSRQTRAGIHLTGLRSGPVEWSAGWGYVSDSFGRTGNYARLAAQMRP